MKTKSLFIRSTLASFRQLSVAALAAVMLVAVPVASDAQETTTRVRGTVTTPDGLAAAGQTVTITDTRTGSQRTATTNASGAFSFRGLPVGGPYEIRVVSQQYQGTLVTDVYTNLSAAASFNIQLGAGDEEIEEIVTVASRVAVADLAIGPGTSFGIEEIEAMPTIARQVRDIIRIDPRVSIGRNDNGGGSGVFCLGGHPRSNAFTIDGTLASDGFGLNEGTGTSARFAFPIPWDTVASASVEFAPLDVQYSQFTGCAINVVTKPGSNEFTGSLVYLYNDDSLTGKDIEGRRVITDPFEDTNWAATVSGPIIKDRLFFTVSYEETDEGGVQNTGPIGAGFANEDFLTLQDAEAIRQVLINQYGRDPGDVVRTLPQTSERAFVRLDWNINDRHRAEATYTKLDELNLDPDDLPFNGFSFRDNFEFEGIDQESISFRLFSDWTDTFSTELRYSNLDVIDIQGPAGGGEAQDPNPITRIIVQDGAGDDILVSGPGFFRSANDLQYTEENFKLAANWVRGNHTWTLGFERATRDIFNLFIPNATGTIEFADFAALQAGTASEITINGSFTQDPRDAAAAFERDIDSFYLQDEIQLSDSITVVAGLRFDAYKSDDLPIFNPVFQQRYGFTNRQTFDGLDLIQPRIGLTWDLPESSWGSTQVRAGYGVFGGGDPTVHFANAYQNFGGAIGFGRVRDSGSDTAPCTDADLQVTDGTGQFTGLPDCVRIAAAASANANTGAVAAVDPDFELPENHRFSVGFTHTTDAAGDFWSDWDIELDFIYTDHKNAVDWLDLTLTPNGVTLPDGRPQFFAVDPLLPGCNATFVGLRQGFANAGTNGGPCDAGFDDQDILMTNGPEGETTSISFQLGKEFEWGDSSKLDLRFGYAYTDAKIGNPVNSSTATSSFEEVAVAVINNVELGPAHWASTHNFVLRARFEHYFFDNNPTRIGMFVSRRSGQAFSYVYDNNTPTTLFGDSDNEERNLFYVPNGPNDPNVVYTNIDPNEFWAFIQASGLGAYAGQITPKNAFNEPWTTDIDLRISQDFPLPWLEHSLEVFFDVENVMNIFSDGKNVRRFIRSGDVQEGVPLVDAALNGNGQYVYSNFQNPVYFTDTDDTVYRIQLGVRYRF